MFQDLDQDQDQDLDLEIPITHYEITNRDIIETIFGSLLVIFGLVGSIICANIITRIILTHPNYKNNTNINIFILFIHIIIILVFIMFIRYIAHEVIHNNLIRDSIFSFIGPVIGASSLYFSGNIQTLVNFTK